MIVLEELDATPPGPGQVLVRVAAAGVGNWDALVRTGRSGLPLSLPLTLGAEVAGTVRQEKDEETARALGATEVIRNQADYARFAQGADVVIDTVGGRSQAVLFSLVRSGGLLISSVSRPDPALALKGQIRTDYFIASVTTAALCEITKLLDAGRLRTRVGATLPLRDARVAHEMLEGTRPRPDGKIVLDVA